MRRYFPILLAVLIPLQSFAAAERGFHAFQGKTLAIAERHLHDHLAQVAHHHDDDDDGDVHEDDSLASSQHLHDFDHGCGSNVILPGMAQLPYLVPASVKPVFQPEPFFTRTTSPPQRPPYAPA